MTHDFGIFRAFVWLRQYLYETGIFSLHNAEAYTLSVGNISTGGTGKTPVSLYLMEKYLQQGKKVAYLSRGYGRKTTGFLQVIPRNGNAFDFGEEALMVAKRFPNCLVAVCENRVFGAKKMKEIADFEVLILDDAFQHFRIYRDEDIVVIDAQKLPFEDNMLPSGNLREPLSALQRADTVIINKLKDSSKIPLLQEKFAPYLAGHTKLFFCCPKLGKARHFFSEESKNLQNMEVIAFAGIGNPDFFRTQLESEGVKVLDFFPFADHHFYTIEDIAKMPANVSLLTTEKDYCRMLNMPILAILQERAIYFVPMELEWLGAKP